MNRYWMEDSFGKYGVALDSFGPYQLPGNSYQYFMTEFGGNANLAHCPALTPAKPCNRNFRTDARAAWLADVGAAKIAEYDNIFYVSAGEDESATWQEFGEMKWKTQEEVPDAFGPKSDGGDLAQTNWAVTRYVPWSSWAAVSGIWPNASGNTSIEAERLRHGHLRARADPQPRPARQLQQPVRHHAAGHRDRHVGHDEPRLVQRPGRPAHALHDPADAG